MKYKQQFGMLINNCGNWLIYIKDFKEKVIAIILKKYRKFLLNYNFKKGRFIMKENLIEYLRSITVASYIVIINPLRRVPRRIGGNAMRHSLSCFNILLDYEIYDSLALKVALCHDLLEDHPDKDWNLDYIKRQIYEADEEGPLVLDRVIELTKRDDETKEQYLIRLINSTYDRVKIVKGADRIANLTDLNTDFTDLHKIKLAIEQTRDLVIPILNSVQNRYEKQANFMITELKDLISNRLKIINKFEYHKEENNK